MLIRKSEAMLATLKMMTLEMKMKRRRRIWKTWTYTLLCETLVNENAALLLWFVSRWQLACEDDVPGLEAAIVAVVYST